jgi:hypothetical protein
LCALFFEAAFALVCFTEACFAEALRCDALTVDLFAAALRCDTAFDLALDEVRFALFFTGAACEDIDTGCTWLVGVTLSAEGRLAPCVRAKPTAGTVAIAITPAAAHFTNRLIIIGNSFAS